MGYALMTHGISPSLRTLGVLLFLVAGFLVTPQVVAPARACATQHSDLWLTGFTEGPIPPHFYMTGENQTPQRFVFEGTVHGCAGTGPVNASWATAGGTANSADYQAITGTSPDLNNPPCSADQDCPIGWGEDITILNDPDQEPVAEHFQLTVDNQGGRMQGPTTVPVYIVDDDGTPRYAFPPTSTLQYSGQEYAINARIPVFRAGSASGTTTVNFSLAGGPGDPAEANDFDPDGGTITFGIGQRLKFLQFQVTNDTFDEDSETITATLTGAGVQSPFTATYTILDEDSDNTPPISRFHHPRNGLTYEYKDLRILVAHIYGKDPGSGMVDADMAVRRLRMSGGCQWWNGNSWVSRSCTSKLWFAMKPDPDTPDEQPYWHEFKPPLAPSIGTSVKNYRAWSRGLDGAGNMETTFVAGRNLSTFEVRPP